MYALKLIIPFEHYSEGLNDLIFKWLNSQSGRVETSLQKGNFDMTIEVVTDDRYYLEKFLYDQLHEQTRESLVGMVTHTVCSIGGNRISRDALPDSILIAGLQKAKQYVVWDNYHPFDRELFETSESHKRRLAHSIIPQVILNAIDNQVRRGTFKDVESSYVIVDNWNVSIKDYIDGLYHRERRKFEPLIRKVVANAQKIYEADKANTKLIYEFSLLNCK